MAIVAKFQDRGLAGAVAANIRAEAAFRGMSQTDVAEALGVTHSTVQIRWWGKRQWQLEELEKVAALFGVPPSQLCAIRDSNPEPADYWHAEVA